VSGRHDNDREETFGRAAPANRGGPVRVSQYDPPLPHGEFTVGHSVMSEEQVRALIAILRAAVGDRDESPGRARGLAAVRFLASLSDQDLREALIIWQHEQPDKARLLRDLLAGRARPRVTSAVWDRADPPETLPEVPRG